MGEIRCSVVMAVYNGEAYIRQQLDSILENVTVQDEIVISDDGSTDKTKEIILAYQKNGAGIRLFDGAGKGVIANFEYAIRQAKGKYIFLCDQDDVWEPNKIERVLRCFDENGCMVVVHDADIWNEKENVMEPSFFQYRNSGAGILKNIVKNTYIGCCMAFCSELRNFILPIPRNIEMHDQWIGIWGDIVGENYFLNEILFHYRRHGKNVSDLQHYPFGRMLKNRIVLCVELLKRWWKKVRAGSLLC